MREEKKLHELVRNTGKDRRKAILEDIHNEIDHSYLSTRTVKTKTPAKRRAFWIAFASVACAAAIVLCFVFIPGSPAAPPDGNRYCTYNDYDTEISNKTIKEYNIEYGSSYLYFDWYDNADILIDKVFTDKADGSLLCLSEDMVDGNSGQRAVILVTGLNLYLDFLDEYTDLCNTKYSGGKYDFLWSKIIDNYCCIFEWNNNRYYLEISDVNDVEELSGIVENLIENNGSNG